LRREEEKPMSTFRCEVVPVVLEPHPNADSLSIVHVWGYTVVVKTADWIGLDRGVYIPPDSLVPITDARFAWLTKPRITVRRFRGIYSQGLLLPLDTPEDLSPLGLAYVEGVGTDLAGMWGITHYEPPLPTGSGGKSSDAIPGPPGLLTLKYDVENFNRYPHCIPEGTPVYVTEKIHGANARYVYPPEADTLYCGSRSHWKAWSEGDLWWSASRQNAWILDWCCEHPNCVLYGEVFGQVQDLKYGAKPGQLFFRAFDVLEQGRWASYTRLEELVAPENRAPVVFLGPFDEALVREIAERDSHVCPGQVAEGVVICPLVEMTHPEIGRVQLKIVSNRYLERMSK
jgi:RNA ligase (TIGR02306 family)